jgi:mono/diheme cytochrome c family protein
MATAVDLDQLDPAHPALLFMHMIGGEAMKPLLAIGLAILSLAAATPALAQTNTDLVKRGEAILSGDCAMCHAVHGSGFGAPGGIPSFSAIARRSDFAELRRELQSGVTSGHPAMPTVSLSGSEIEAVLAYLHTLQQP